MLRNCMNIQYINNGYDDHGSNEMNYNLWYLQNEALFDRFEGPYENSNIFTIPDDPSVTSHINIKIEIKRFFCNFKDHSQKCSNDFCSSEKSNQLPNKRKFRSRTFDLLKKS